jgi:hypothetical protein
MQVRHYYEDPLPSVRNPLNSIALSPDSIRYNSYSLQNVQEDFGDFQSILPSPSSCFLYGDGSFRKPARLIRWLQRCRGRIKSKRTNGTWKGDKK